MKSFAILALFASLAAAAPTPLERRDVGTLTCHVVKTGTLTLTDTKSNKVDDATLANDFTLDDALAGRQRPDSIKYEGNPRLLSAYPGSKAQEFEFLACKESSRPGFEDYSPEKDGVYYGHLSLKTHPNKCLKHVSVYADEAYLANEECYFSDDSGSPFYYFSYSPKDNGRIKFLQYTGPKGANPPTADEAKAEFDFTPGSSQKAPAVGVHDGSPQFSSYELRLN